MRLDSLCLVNFRNYASVQVDFSPYLNLVRGRNAQGKTNLLEAIYLLCLGRSFRVVRNQELLRTGENFFRAESTLHLDNSIEKVVAIRYERDGRKDILIDHKRLGAYSQMFGQFPVVIMAPDEFRVTSGGPSDRRRFLDILLSQVSLSYLADLQEYHRVLRQRNKILHGGKEGRSFSESTLAPWTDKLVQAGSRVLSFRRKFVLDFREKVKKLYSAFSQTDDVLEISIDSTVPEAPGIAVGESFHTAIETLHRRERATGSSLVGPHRDDLIFSINGLNVRKYGSRGEHKSVLMCLKLAEYNYLWQRTSERPLLLLDDCYSELDDSRARGIFNSLRGLGQIFMTDPKNGFRADALISSSRQPVRNFLVRSGNIELVPE